MKEIALGIAISFFAWVVLSLDSIDKSLKILAGR